MHEKNKFYFFIVLILIISVLGLKIKSRMSPAYQYAHQNLTLDFVNKKTLPEEKKQFIETITRAAQYSNFQILEERKVLNKIDQTFQKKHGLSSFQKHQLNIFIQKYKPKDENIEDSVMMMSLLHELKVKINIVPVRLALAQAILESAWGSSRFAKEGNAFFGIHCYDADCGMSFGNSKKVFVKSYPDMQSSVEDYMLFLNAKNGPRKFRQVRSEYLKAESPDIIHLAESLDSYSEIGGNYHKILADLFRTYIPDQIADY